MEIEGFTRTEIATSGARIVLSYGGNGPPLLLLHGNPFTHVHWHEIAPRLARDFTVVCPDLRGYGDSSKPPGTSPGGQPHANYSFRAMALDQVETMAALGFGRFHAAGHDRGARVVHRLCLDHPEKVMRAAVLDIIPQHHLYNHPTTEWATASYHWFFMIQPYDMPERLMSAEPEYFLRRKLSKTEKGTSFFDERAMAEYIRCFKNTATVHAMCEDYRATATIDRALDTVDFAAGRKVATPLLVLWGAAGSVGRHFKPLEIWRNYASDIRAAKALPCGHYLAPEVPEETYAALHEFFAGTE